MATTDKSAPPNIIFILVDDQRNDTLGCAGHPVIKTPVIDSLAAGGVRFRNAFVNSPVCAASRASILTGLNERHHRFTFGTAPIRQEHLLESYPLLLRRAGYHTGFIGKLGVKLSGTRPADLFDDFKPLGRSPYFKKLPDGALRHEAELAGDHAVAFLSRVPKDKPFCLSVSFNSAHAEDHDMENHYPSPKSSAGMYARVNVPPPRLSDPAIFESQPEFLKQSLNRQRYFWRWDTPEKYQKNMRDYFAMISGIDRVIGRVLKSLEKLGLEENTVIVYTSDNGYYMGDRGFAGKWSHYEESLRVPLIIYDPRLPPNRRGRILDELAVNIDLPATFLELGGLDTPARYDGKSLVSLLRGQDTPAWRDGFMCEFRMQHDAIPTWEGVRGTRYMYARYLGQDPPYEFLHDLQLDPDQLDNFIADPTYTSALYKMQRRLQVFLKDQ